MNGKTIIREIEDLVALHTPGQYGLWTIGSAPHTEADERGILSSLRLWEVEGMMEAANICRHFERKGMVRDAASRANAIGHRCVYIR